MAKAKMIELNNEAFVAARKKLQLTQMQLATELGITTRSVQMYERKGSAIPRKIGMAIAYLLSK